jgi:hypothetical protein
LIDGVMMGQGSMGISISGIMSMVATSRTKLEITKVM